MFHPMIRWHIAITIAIISHQFSVNILFCPSRLVSSVSITARSPMNLSTNLSPTLDSFSDVYWISSFNTLRPKQNGRHFADDTFNLIFVNENVRISIKFTLKYVPKGPIDNIPASVQIMAWRRPGNKPISEPVMVSPLTHICVTRPQWVICTCVRCPIGSTNPLNSF